MLQAVGADGSSNTSQSSNSSQALAFQQALNNAGAVQTPPRPANTPANGNATKLASNGGQVNGGQVNGNQANSNQVSGGQSSDVRRQQIDDWVEHHSDASGGFLGFGQTSAADHVREALDGKSKELGPLSTDEQRYLLDKVLDRWSAGRGDGPGGAAELASSVSGDPQLSGVVAQQLAAKSASLMQRPPGDGSFTDPHSQARAYALDAIQAASGDLGSTPKSYAGLRQTMNSLGPQGAARFLQALNPTAPGNAYFLTSQAQGRVLAAMNAGPQTQTTSAVVQTIFAQTTPGALNADPAQQQEMAKALAREWHPDDPAKQRADTSRLAGILGTEQGQQLLFGSGNVPLDARVNALAIVRSDPSITGAKLAQTSDPWTNPAILGPMARANAQQYLSLRGDATQTLRGSDLPNTVGFAMGFAPTLPHDQSAEAAQAKAAMGQFSYFAQGPGQKPVQAVVDQIRKVGGDSPQVTVLPIEYGSSDYGPVQLPLFRVHTASGDQYVDNVGRSYSSFEDWRNNNQLPPGTVFYPEGGHLTAGPDGSVKLASSNTPSTPDTAWKQVKSVLNTAALVGGIIAGGALIIGTDGLATPIVASVAVASGAWGAYSSGSELMDRSQHGQSIDPIHDSTARGLWLSLAANTAGMGAFASEAALARIASAEGTLSSAAAWTIGTTKVVANVTNGAAFVNAGVDLSTHWGSMTAEQRAQSILSMGFWGVTMLAGSRQARSPGDLFNPAGMTRAIADAYQPPVTRTTELGGNRVEIVLEPQSGRPMILAGENASAADIQLHVNVARMMARNQGLQGQINGLLGREPAPGTLAYSAKYESIKLNQKVADLQAQLENPNLTAQQRTQLQGDIDTTNAYLDQQLASLQAIARSPGLATVAAPSDGRARAEELPGLVDALEKGPYAHQGYYFRIQRDPDLAPEIVRGTSYDRDHPRLAAYQKDDGTWGIKTVDTDPALPAFRAQVDDGAAASSVTLPSGLTRQQQADLRAALAARQRAADTYRTANDPDTQNAAGYRVTVQSNLIGEIGARAYVQSEFPNAKPIYGGNGSRPGDFDQVYRQVLPDGKVRFIVVEAKGGSSPLGAKIVNGRVETQGTPDYFESTANSMRAMRGDTPNARNARGVGSDLVRAYNTGKTADGKPAEIVYIVVRTPISTQGGTARVGTVSARQFELTH